MTRLIAGLLAARLAHGCSCGPPQPLCSYIASVDVILIGEVISSNDDGTGTFAQLTLERVRVVDAFKGLPAETKEVWVNPGSGSSCYSSHTVGKRYLFKGSTYKATPDMVNRSMNRKGEKKALPEGFNADSATIVYSGGCYSSQRVEDAGADLEFLRAWQSGEWKPQAIGGLYQNGMMPQFYQNMPLPNANVTMIGPAGEYHSTTGLDGKFLIPDVSPGRYQMSFRREGFSTTIQSSAVTVPLAGCGWLEANMNTNVRFQVHLVGPSGGPVPSVSVSMHVEDGEGNRPIGVVKTDANGLANFTELPSATYFIVVNPVGKVSAELPYPTIYYPGVSSIAQATRIKAKPNELVAGLTFRLPEPLAIRPVIVRPIVVTVLNEKGQPLDGARVFAKSLNGEFGPSELTKVNGEATLGLNEDTSYRIEAWKEYGNGKPHFLDFLRGRKIIELKPSEFKDALELRITEWKTNAEWDK